jgi:hypothetical protein
MNGGTINYNCSNKIDGYVLFSNKISSTMGATYKVNVEVSKPNFPSINFDFDQFYYVGFPCNSQSPYLMFIFSLNLIIKFFHFSCLSLWNNIINSGWIGSC